VSQGDVTKFRAIRFDATNGGLGMGAPVDGPPAPVGTGTAPHYQMSPTSTAGMATTGFVFFLKAVAGGAVPIGGGYTVTVWARDPNTFRWAAMMPAGGVASGTIWLCADVNAMDALFFQITNVDFPSSGSGLLDLHFAEQ
jgi:hypothetical protein